MSNTLIVCNDSGKRELAHSIARATGSELLFNVPVASIASAEFALVLDITGVELAHTGRKAPGPVRCDFGAGAVNHRRQFGGGKGQMIAKACGIGAHVFPEVLDATAGLGRDAFVLATLGCRVQMLERNHVVHALLRDGLERASLSADESLTSVISRMSLLDVDSRLYLYNAGQADVVYLDPMFPERQKSAQVKKEMKAFHTLVGSDSDADDLLPLALAVARYRVVVKRPRKAPYLAEHKPSYSLEGKSSRFDIYALHKLPTELNDDAHARSDTAD